MANQIMRTSAAARAAFLILLIAMTSGCAITGSTPTQQETASSPEASPSPSLVTLTPTVQILRSDQAAFATELGKPFGLAEGQTARIPSEGLETTYVRLVEDTRCPEDRECEWPGEVMVEYGVTKNERDLGTFQIGSHGTGQVVDSWVISIWDAGATAVIVRTYVETMSRSTSSESSVNCTPGAGQISTFINPDATITETHVLGIYDTGRWPSVANVYVVRQNAPLVLVLSAYRATAWRIHRA